jgi:hypothetical protein
MSSISTTKDMDGRKQTNGYVPRLGKRQSAQQDSSAAIYPPSAAPSASYLSGVVLIAQLAMMVSSLAQPHQISHMPTRACPSVIVPRRALRVKGASKRKPVVVDTPKAYVGTVYESSLSFRTAIVTCLSIPYCSDNSHDHEHP